MSKVANFWLEEASKQLTPEQFEEIMGELWLRIRKMDEAAAAGTPISKILEYEIRRARGLLHNPDNRVRSRPHRYTVTTDPSSLDMIQKMRRKW